MTVQDLISASLNKAGRLGHGRTPGASESAASLGFLNRLVANWNLQRCYVNSLDTVTVAVTSGLNNYTLGVRPTHIERAEFIFTAGGLTYPMPLEICGVDQFRAIPNQGDVTVSVKGLWCDYGYPTAHVYLAPTPASGSLRIFTWTAIGQFAALAETVALAPGVEAALVDNLALELASAMATNNTPLSPALIAAAAQSKGALEKLNLWHAGDAKQAAYPEGKAA